jgi:haloacetate dehalogenase
MGQDQLEVIAALAFERFDAAGHDQGARTLHRMCLDYPPRILAPHFSYTAEAPLAQ